MKNLKKRLFSFLLAATLLCVGFVTPTYAAETEKEAEPKCYTIEVSSNGVESISDESGYGISTYSSISGYNQRSIKPGDAGIAISATSSGWGGMGVTIEASSSWSGTMNANMVDSDGRTIFSGRNVSSNGSTKFASLWHYNPSYYYLTFGNIPSGQSVFIKVWIYG